MTVQHEDAYRSGVDSAVMLLDVARHQFNVRRKRK